MDSRVERLRKYVSQCERKATATHRRCRGSKRPTKPDKREARLPRLWRPDDAQDNGVRGIRTLEQAFRPATRFPVVLLRPTRTSLHEREDANPHTRYWISRSRE